MKNTLLAGASALCLAIGASAASAQSIFGSGATLPAFTVNDLFASYKAAVPAQAATYAYGGNGIPPTGASANAGVGSGNGIRGWQTNDPLWHARNGAPLYPDVNFAASEAALTDIQLGVYNNGGTVSGTVTGATTATSQSVLAPTVPQVQTATNRLNPRVAYGPAIQVPFLLTPVTIAYDPIYKRVRTATGISEFRLNVRTPRADGSGGLRLDRSQYCAIFNGQITNWNDARLRTNNVAPGTTTQVALVPGVNTATGALDTTTSLPLQVVYRTDTSGTTALFYRHIAAACAGTTGNQFTITSTGTGTDSFPAALRALANFQGANGNNNVAALTNTATPTATVGNTVLNGRITYLSPDFVLPVAAPGRVPAQPADAFGLNTATLRNRSNAWVGPTPTATTASLAVQTPPTPANVGLPTAWVANPAARPGGVLNPVADPAAAAGYPIVGSSNLLLYSCYDTAAKTASLARPASAGTIGFLNWLYSAAAADTVLANNGFAPVSTSFKTLITSTFLTPAGTSTLRIRTAPVAGFCSTGS